MQAQPNEITGSSTIQQPAAHTVLFVDDEERILKAIRRALRSETYTLMAASSADAALRIMARQPVQVIVSDMHMPEMDGVALLSRVERQTPDVVRLVLSGQSDARVIIDAINSGSIYRYILKPWDDDQLRITIRQAFELWDLQAERRYLMDALTAQNRHLEELVDQRTRQVLAVERQADIGRYASQIVHNLSNPLNAVSAAIDLLMTYVADGSPAVEKMERGLTIARSAAADLRDIIAGILSHAREQVSFIMAPVDINRLIEKEMAFFEMIPDFKYGVETTLLLDPMTPRIKGNPIQIKQILGNLVKNSLDAMEAAIQKRLTIATATDGDEVEIRVSDTGEGIAPENIPRVFSSDFTTKPIGKGTGLGLASVQTMVDAYAGSIRVESTHGEGTTFIVRLPALKTPD